MRIKLLFCFFIVTIFTKAQTSVYHPFPDSNAVWIVSSGCCNWAQSCGAVCCNITTRYEQTNDTIISGKPYHKIQASSSWSCNPPCAGPCMYVPMGEFYIREDSAKKIWTLGLFSVQDTLLYDFNLNVGDTINTVLTSPGDTNVIYSVDSMLIGNDYRNIYYYHSNYSPDTCTQFLIEGVGSGAGLFSELCGSCFEHGYSLSCFKQDGSVMYYLNNPLCSSFPDTATICNFTVSVPEREEQKLFSIFPNPAISELTVRSSEFPARPAGGGDKKIELIEIYDVFGEKVLSTDVPFFSFGRRSLEDEVINVSTLTPGIYFARIRTENGTITKKFIKQ